MDFKNWFGVIALLVQCTLLQTQHLASETKIVQGSLSPPASVPHAVALTVGKSVKSLFCGGSLVSLRTVLTAAHCVDAVFKRHSLWSSLRVTIGTNNWKSGGQTYAVSHNVTHPDFTETKYDIGILYTAILVVQSESVRPVKLDFDYVCAGVACKVAGWGYTKENGEVSDVLYELTMTTINVTKCVDMAAQASIDFHINAPAVDPNIEICTFHLANPIDHGMCNGDSGGALVRIDRGTQIGSVSWGFPCARGAPDMFVRFSAFKEFLNNNVINQ